MRYFPIPAGGSVHVPLAIVDELEPGGAVSPSPLRAKGRGP